MPNAFDTNPDAFLAQMMGLPSPSPSVDETRNNLFRYISSLAGGSGTPASVEDLQAHPAWGTFVQQAAEAGLDPAELVNARNQNIGDFESGGIATNIGDFMERSGLDDIITYGSIGGGLAGAGTALAGALGASAGGAAGGSSGLSTIGLPAGVGQIPVTGGAGVVLPSAGGAAGAGGLASMPPLSGAAGSSLGGSGLLSQINVPEGVGRISEGGSMPGFWDNWGGQIVGGAAGLLDSLMQPDEQTVRQQQQLAPEVQEALRFLIDQSMGLQDADSIVPELSGVTQQGIESLSDPLGGPGFDALSGFASGNIGSDLSGVENFVTDAATRAVGDRFSQAGRSGSPAEGMSLAKTITQELSPFAFNAQQSNLDRRLSAAQPLMNAQRQQGLDTLTAGGILDEQRRRRALEPFQRLNLISSPLTAAIGGAPTSTSTTRPLFSSPLSSGLGGALTGMRLQGLLADNG